jgi:hypothetical protein
MLASCFHYGSNQRVTYWSYVVAEVANGEQWSQVNNAVKQISETLRFTIQSQLPFQDFFSNFDYWVYEFVPDNPALKDEGVYLNCFRNGVSQFDFEIRKGEPTNPYQPHEHLVPELLAKELITNNPYFKVLYTQLPILFHQSDQAAQICRAIEWFNRSFSHKGRGVDSSEAILNVHTALEALLRPKQGDRGVKAEIKTALLTLLGHRPEISDWFDAFYNLRNSLIHGDVEPSSFTYIHPKSLSRKGNRRHLDLAREIFVGALNAMLRTAEEYPLLGFEKKLLPNETRVANAIRELKSGRIRDWKTLAHSKVRQLHDLSNDDISSPKEETVKLGNLLLPIVRKELEENNKAGSYDLMLFQIDRILQWSGEKMAELAMFYANLQQAYQQPYFHDLKNDDQRSLRGIAYAFLSYASWRLMVFGFGA